MADQLVFYYDGEPDTEVIETSGDVLSLPAPAALIAVEFETGAEILTIVSGGTKGDTGPQGPAGLSTGAAGGDLTGNFPNPTIGALKVTDAKVAAANKDGAAATPSMRTLGTGATQAAAGNDARLSDARTPTAHGHALTDSLITGVLPIAKVPTGQTSATVPLGNDARFSDSRTPSGTASGDLTGNYPGPSIAALAVTDAKVAASNKDGAAATPSMRTLGTGATQAAAGTHGHALTDANITGIIPNDQLPANLQAAAMDTRYHHDRGATSTLDADTFTGGGTWRVQPGVANLPAGAYDFGILSVFKGSTGLVQMYASDNLSATDATRGVWFRSDWGSDSWGGWVKVSMQGRVLAESELPALPRARASRTASDLVMTNNAITTIPWNNETLDTDNLHSTVTNPSRITLNRAGAWLITSQVTYSQIAAAGVRDALMYRNGVEIARNTAYPPASGAGVVAVFISSVVSAAANDYIEMKGYQNSGSALVLEWQWSYLSATYLGN